MTRGAPRQSRVGFVGYVVLLVLACFAAGPIVLFVLSSFKTRPELAENPFGLPSDWHLENFTTAWREADMGTGLLNTAVLIAGTLIGVILVSSMAAYGLARLELPGSVGVIASLLVIGSLPAQMFLVPLFYLETRTGLYDTHLGVILIYVGTLAPFATLLLRSFLVGLPRELEEAARVDGAGELTIAARVVLPNALPGILTVALVNALAVYNEFFFAVTFLQSPEKLPVSTSLYAFQTGYSQDPVLIAAAGVIMLIPMLLLFLVLQRRVVEGIASTGLSA